MTPLVDQKEKSIERLVSELLPSSLVWMERRGYIERFDEDGEPTIRITETGYEYLNSVGVQK